MFSMKLYNNTLEKTSINFMFNKIEMRGTKGMKLKEGVYTSKELCNMLGYSYNTFKQNKGKTFFSKLQQVCSIEKTGSGKGTKYIISNISNSNIDINKRKTRENKGRKEYTTMSDLFKAPIVNLLLTRDNGIFTGTIDNWLVHTSLVHKGFKNKNEKFINDCDSLNSMERDFFCVEGQSLHYNFVQALEKLRKSNDISWYKVRMVVETTTVNGKKRDVHRCVKDDDELAKLLKFENDFNRRFAIKDRNDLLYGNSKYNIKRNTTRLKEYDSKLRKEIDRALGYKYTYTAYMVALSDNSDYNRSRLTHEYCNDFNMDSIKDAIYQYRASRAKIRQDKTKERLSKGFGIPKELVLLTESEIRLLQYEETYIDKWLQLYNEYIHNTESKMAR